MFSYAKERKDEVSEEELTCLFSLNLCLEICCSKMVLFVFFFPENKLTSKYLTPTYALLSMRQGEDVKWLDFAKIKNKEGKKKIKILTFKELDVASILLDKN